MKRLARILTAVLLGLIAMGNSPSRGEEPVWEGSLELRPGATLRFVVHLKPDTTGKMTGTLDSLDEGYSGLKLTEITLDKSKLAFELPVSAARYDGTLDAAGTESTGTWSQRGLKLPLKLVRKAHATSQPKLVGQAQIWEGKLAVGNGLSLRLVVQFAKTDSGDYQGTFESPDQGAMKLQLSEVTLDKSRLGFSVKLANGSFDGTLNSDGTEATGNWSQGGAKLPLVLKKTDKVTAVRRPQTPKPPFPYQSEAVSYANKAAGVNLAGTLTIPRGREPFPAVIFISGSGAQDRDETIFEHRPFLVLADYLARRGIAALRVDDRGVGGSTGSVENSTSEDFAGDVLAGIAFLKGRKEIDAHKIGLIGHSEGGLIAPMVAARSKDVAFIVLLAGTGLTGEEIMYLQGGLIARSMGADDKRIAELKAIQKRLFDIVRTERDPAKLKTRMAETAKALVAELTPNEKKAAGDAATIADAQLDRIQSRWFRFFLTYDPRPTLARVSCPVLALNGGKDLQVPPKENLAEIAKALQKGGNSRVTVRELPGLNHLFQTAKTGAVSEYAEIDETIAQPALEAVGTWIDLQREGR
jgi:pimeloyl-ACP methyl ester carboxylesterase